MKRRLSSAVCIIVAFLTMAGCGTTGSAQNGGEVNGHSIDEQSAMMTFAGSSSGRPFSPGEMYQVSDIVVMGSPTGYDMITKRAVLDRAYPEDLKPGLWGWLVNVKVHTFKVDKYIKGEGPDTIEVMTVAGDHPDSEITLTFAGDGDGRLLDMEEDTTYVLYLRLPRDREFWGNRYFLWNVGDSLWRVSVDEDSGAQTATQELESGDQLPLQTLIDSRTGTSRSNSFKRIGDARTVWDASGKEINGGSGEGPTGNVND